MFVAITALNKYSCTKKNTLSDVLKFSLNLMKLIVRCLHMFSLTTQISKNI